MSGSAIQWDSDSAIQLDSASQWGWGSPKARELESDPEALLTGEGADLLRVPLPEIEK